MSAVEKTKQGVKSFPVYEENPYVKELATPGVVKKRNKMVGVGGVKLIVDPTTGEYEQTGVLAVKEEVETEEFVKIYKGHISSLFGLSQNGIKVFGYFLDATRISNDQIVFDIDKCMKFTGYKSRQPIFNGLAELLSNEFIARTKMSAIYYINPKIFFNGNRLVVVKEYVKKKNSKYSDPNQGVLALSEAGGVNKNPGGSEAGGEATPE